MSAALTSDGSLTVTFVPKQGCTLADDLHVDLTTVSSGVGTSVIPVPGQFGCQAPAEGGTQTLDCDISDFALSSCCDQQLRLFLHAVITCDGGPQETAFGGTAVCTTKRWCTYQVVAVDENCPTCTQCSGSQCANIASGTTDDGCESRQCTNGIPNFEACDGSGTCNVFESPACATCKNCDPATGLCANVPTGMTDDGCDGIECISETTFKEKSCDEGTCVLGAEQSCEPCHKCSNNQCVPVDGDTLGSCAGSACGSSTSQGSLICREGTCVRENDETCGDCETCNETVNVPGGTCTAVDNDTETANCSGTICTSDMTQANRRCFDGTCSTGADEGCGTCKSCPAAVGSQGACGNVDDDTQTADCTDECSDATQLVRKSCQGGSCESETQLCGDCKTCTSATATCDATSENEPDGACDGTICTGLYEESRLVCQGGQCATVPSGCDTCSSCSAEVGSAGSCQAVTDGTNSPGCEDECSTAKTVLKKMCVNGSCAEEEETCDSCKKCDESSATCDGVIPDGDTDGTCTGTICTGTYSEANLVCQGGSCSQSESNCASCQSCTAATGAPGSCSDVADNETTPGCEGTECIGNAVVAMNCAGGTCQSTTTACSTCSTCSTSTNSCEAVNDLQTSDCEDKCEGNTAVKRKCSNGICTVTSTNDCGICATCSNGSCVNNDGPNDNCNGAICQEGSRGTQSCSGGLCVFVAGAGPCPDCQECTGGQCTPVADGTETASCNGAVCIDSTTSGSKQCKNGMCDMISTGACTQCNNCGASGTCEFDPTSPTREVCGICGEQCSADSGSLGSCKQRLSCQANTICDPGVTDDQDVCKPTLQCTSNTDCDASESCIENKCVSDSVCTAEKEKFCDDLYQKLGNVKSNESKCCPDTSSCVKNTLKLNANSVCSTVCGASCSTTQKTKDNVFEVYCRFGESTSTATNGVPLCSSL